MVTHKIYLDCASVGDDAALMIGVGAAAVLSLALLIPFGRTAGRDRVPCEPTQGGQRSAARRKASAPGIADSGSSPPSSWMVAASITPWT